MDPKKVFGEAAKTYKKQQSGGSVLSPLSPEAVSGMPHSSGTELQIEATQFSGGKKRSVKKSHHKKSHHKKSHHKKSHHKKSHHKKSHKKSHKRH
jgi:hypothetical protein